MESESNPETDPVVLWLQGGPGSSSLYATFVEFGPYIIQPNGTFVENKYSWTSRANLLWIDSPVGTGFSYTQDPDGYVKRERTLAQDLLVAITEFMRMHPEYSKQEFYIFGESYAGKYLPWLAYTIINTTDAINLKGIGIGDGWVDPYWQAKSYGPYLYYNHLINESTLQLAASLFNEYAAVLKARDYLKAFQMDNDIFALLLKIANVGDIYDIRYQSDPSEPNYNAMVKYLSRQDVMEALHTWGRSNFSDGDVPYHALDDDEERSARFLVPLVINAGVKILLYNGEYDPMCDWIGTRDWMSTIRWAGQNDFNQLTEMPWTVDGSNAGRFKSLFPVVELVVYQAGHLSPFDQPKNTLSMLNAFIDGDFYPTKQST